VALAVVLLAPALAAPAPAAPAPAAAEPASPRRGGYLAPVDGAVVDPFRPPATRYGPGNRGLEYATTPRGPVRAAAAGVVTFAGPVAGTRVVVVAHPDGLRTSYTLLATIAVTVGQPVARGAVLGTTGPRLHFGVRRGDVYLDPALLLEQPSPLVRVRLVPSDPRPGHDDELARLRGNGWRGGGGDRWGFLDDVVGGVAAGASAVAGAAVAVAGAVADALSPQAILERVRALADVATNFLPYLTQVELALALFAWWDQLDECTPADVSPPTAANRHHLVVLVAGYGSDGEGDAIDGLDVAALGYDPARVARFSYAGGRVPDPTDGPALTVVPAQTYDHDDSTADLTTAAIRLRALLAELAAAHPGVPIDVVAHSLGGVVAVRAVQQLDPPALPLPENLTVVTLGAPHAGSTLAGAFGLARSGVIGRLGFDGAGALVGLDPSTAAADDLRPTSPFMRDYRHRPLTPGVEVTSVASRMDGVVPVDDTALDGARRVVVNGELNPVRAHAALPGHPDATREVALALAGLDPTCRGLLDALADHVAGGALELGWDLGGLLLTARP